MIEKALPDDMDFIFKLYDLATAYQKTKFAKSWIGFERELIEQEIVEGRLWKIVVATEVACIFSIAFSDALIWGGKDHDPAIYLHRIAVDPIFRGNAYVLDIIEWAKKMASANNIHFIRLDTFSDNQELNDYYRRCGLLF